MSDSFSLHGVQRHVLPNGLRVLVRRDTAAPVVSIVTHVNAGYFDEPDSVIGVAHVLEHMYFKGTARRGVGEIARQTKASGGYLNAHTIYDHTAYFTVLPSSGFEAGLDIQSDAFMHSQIDADELARELEVIIQEAKRKLDTAGAVANETLFALMHDRHRVRRWRIGTEAGLRALVRDDVHGFYSRYYTPANSILSIVGDVDVDTALQHVERFYGDMPAADFVRDRGPAEESQPGFRHREWEGDIAQTQLVLGWRTPASEHPDTVALDMLEMLLSAGRASRLYRTVRDRQLASSVYASNYTPVEVGMFTIHAETRPEQAADAAAAIWSQVRAVRAGETGDTELNRAKRILEARWLRRFESMDGQAMWLAAWEGLGDWKLGDDYFRKAMAVTPDDITRVASVYLDPAQASIVEYRPRGTQPVATDAATLRERLEKSSAPPFPVEATHSVAASISIRRQPKLEQVAGAVKVYRTESGVPILVRRMPGSPLMHAAVHVPGGALVESTDNAGLTLLASRAAIKGTRKRTAAQIAEDLELNGGAIGASVGAEGFGWSVSAPLNYAASTLGILAEITQEPLLDPGAIESERAVLLGEIAQARDDMYRYPLRLALQGAYGSHPYGRSVLGTEASVGNIDAKVARRWHATNVLSSGAVLAIVADEDEDVLASRIGSVFSALEPGRTESVHAPKWPLSATRTAESREKEQTAIALAFPSAARSDADRFVAELIATIGSGLGGRFFDELRDKQSLAYTVHAFASHRRTAGTFFSYIATSPEKEEQAIQGMQRELDRFCEDLVPQDELQRAVVYTLGARAIGLQSGAAVLGELLDAWVYGSGLEEINEVELRIRQVTPERIREFARAHFDTEIRADGIIRGTGAK